MRRATVGCRWLCCAGLLAGTFLGCTNKSPAPPTAGSTAPPATSSPAPPFAQSSDGEQYDKQDPCALLDPTEVEAVLGESLAVPPYRSANATVDPVPSGGECIYETGKFRYISLSVTYTGGAQVYSMTVGMLKNLMKGGAGSGDISHNVKKNFKLDDGTEMSGEWDEASLTPMNCCIFDAMRGDQLITIDFTASPMTLRQAADLVDAAYKRIDHPLKIDGGAAVKAAKTFDKTRPKPVDPCSLLTRAEVEAILGPLSAAPKVASQSNCTYLLQPQNNMPVEVDLQLNWRGGYSQWRSDHHVAAIGTSALNQIVTDVRGGHPIPNMPTGEKDASAAAGQDKPGQGLDPAEMLGSTGMGVGAVRRDVLVKVVGNMNDKAKQEALAAAVLQKI